MRSLEISDESESQPRTIKSKKLKLPRKLLNGLGTVNHASVPRKLRSAFQRRSCESGTPSLSNQNHVRNEVGLLRKNCLKKSKLKMNCQVTKDEEEVAETLYALADMFSVEAKTDKPTLVGEPCLTKSSSQIIAAKEAGILTWGEVYKKFDGRITLEAAESIQDVNFKPLDDSQPLEFMFNKQYLSPGNQSTFSIDPRPEISEFGVIPNELTTILEKVVTSEIQYCPAEGKSNGLFLWPNLSSTASQRSETPESCQELPARFRNTTCATQHCVTDETAMKDKYKLFEVDPKTPWKRCFAHVYISRWIKVLQISERKEWFFGGPTHIKTGERLDLGPHENIDNQKMVIGCMKSLLSSNGIKKQSTAETKLADVQNSISPQKSLHEQLVPKTSSLNSSIKQGSESLYYPTEGCGLDSSDGAGHRNEVPKQFFMSYPQSQNHSPMLSSHQNWYSLHGQHLALAAQQVQLPLFHSSPLGGRVIDDPTRHHCKSQQQKQTAPSPVQYCTTGISTQHCYLPMLQDGGTESALLINNTQALFPDLHSGICSNRQQQFTQAQFNSISPRLYRM